MPYTNSNSLVAADVNNMLRGLYRDATSHTLTGTVNETDLASLSITAGVLTATSWLHIIASGNITNVGGGAKTVRLYLGATAVATVSRSGANAQDWLFDAWMYNTAADAQRWTLMRSTADLLTLDGDDTTSSIDTASTQTLKVTGQLVDATDTITEKSFAVFVVQVS